MTQAADLGRDPAISQTSAERRREARAGARGGFADERAAAGSIVARDKRSLTPGCCLRLRPTID
jgi:hypothetical protein